MSIDVIKEPFCRLAPSAALLVDNDTDVFTGIFSNESVGRDNHIVLNRGIQYDNFMRDPVIPFAHDATQPPVGRAVNIDTTKDDCRISWKFVPREISAFAGMVRDLVAGGWLRALSMSWQPLEWKFSTDRNRPGGVDFLKVDLLEVSIVPIPALPDALIDARARGVNTTPLYEWAEKLLDTGGMILVPRDELETLRRAAKMPASTRTDDSTKGKHEALKAKHARALVRAPTVPAFKRGLYDVAQFAYALQNLGYLHDCSEYEAALEEDESPVPEMLGEALVKLGEAFKAMASEEVDELLAAVNDEEDEDGEIEEAMRKLSPEARAHIAAAGSVPARAWRAGIAVARAGKALSVSNGKKLEEANGHHERAMKHHRAVTDHHEELGEHLDAAQDHHERARTSLEQLGEHLRAIQDPQSPEDADSHIDEALKYHRATQKHHEAVTDAHEKADEKHEDLSDSHHALGRSVKRAQGCVRAVLEGAQTSEPDNETAEDLEDEESAKKERAARERRAKAILLRGSAA
jgi:HK97 family phage prohead protease